jgi:acetyl esterase/lipase
MKFSFFIAAFFSIFLFSSCSKDDPLNPDNGTVTKLNVAYGSDPLQQLDVYLPAIRSYDTTKVLLMIHGGAWSAGDKTDFAEYIDTLKKRLPNYAIININYRLASTGVNLFPTQENDVKAAVDFVISKRSDYAISDKMILLGASAGGHLALLQGYKNSTINPKAIVNFFGPSDMTDMYNNPASPFAAPELIAGLFGATPTSNPAIYTSSGPINFVSAQSPPTITLQGGADPLVRPAQQLALQAKLNTSGVINEYVFYPTESHGWTGPNLVDSFDKIVAFLKANVQ